MFSTLGKIKDAVADKLDINHATLSGCLDIIVVEQSDGSLASTPFHVRFGKLKVFTTKTKSVKVIVNDKEVNFVMKLGKTGEAYFEERVSPIEAPEAEDDHESEFSDDDFATPPEDENELADSVSKLEKLKQDKPTDTKEETKIEIDTKGKDKDKGKPKTDTAKKEEPKKKKKEWFGWLRSSKKKDNKSKKDDPDDQFDEDEQQGDIGLSLCGGKLTEEEEDIMPVFQKYRIPFKIFSQDPLSLMNHPDLMVKIGENLYSWKVACPIMISMLAYKQNLPEDSINKLVKKQMKKSSWRTWFSRKKKDSKKDKSSSFKDTSGAPGAEESGEFIPTASPTSEMLKSLNLKQGANEIIYAVKTKLRGIQKIQGNIYFLPRDGKIIISDIDGTITKSDVLGQLLPMIGKDWSHAGVTELYTSIANNGYHILYLTARAIGQSRQVRKYLNKLTQVDNVLPKGPVIMSPDRLMHSFKREVIDRQPQIFKIACLQGIKDLFPEDVNPFYAGFGNRGSDTLTYQALGIKDESIYIINSKSQIIKQTGEKTTYPEINEKVNTIFPKIEKVNVEKLDDEKVLNVIPKNEEENLLI